MTFNIKIFGIVQGVGFRPFVSRTASALSICGTVANKGSYVEIFAQCDNSTLESFIDAIKKNSPPRSAILKIDVVQVDDKNFSAFEIIDSEHETGDIFVSPDIAICDNCRRELFDKSNRRYLHPFINCTACGPRLTILENMPYDRERTSMKNFPMCDNCAKEYFSPDSRRYDAQPICCHDCGPKLKLIIKNEELKIGDDEIIKTVRKILAKGGIVAIKGIGGFHLACDVKNFDAVQRLRESKTRPTKPFAVMFKNLDAVKRQCAVTDAQKNFLESPQKPIVLLEKNSAYALASNVAPKINRLGAMLPYTPLHLLIFDYPDGVKNFPTALVMTSGNPAGSPITVDDDDALENFGFCDAILSNDRKILLRADDSVIDFIDDAPSMIRRSRGYAPLPIVLTPNPCHLTPKLAIGGELKNTFCLAKNNLLYASPYIGDIGNLKSVDVLKSSVKRMCDLLEISPEVVICDKHPRWQSAKVAAEIAKNLDVPLIKIQHHYAHILSCLAENNFHDEVIGVAFDGTGYGDDGTIWGGEFFICDGKNYKRVNHIEPFTQAGGDKSAREGWRSAISMMKDFDVDEVNKRLKFTTPENIFAQKFLLDNKINCVTSTSCGRLFDAVSAVLGICAVSTYEGEAAMRLQSIAEKSTCALQPTPYNLQPLTSNLFNEILTRRLEGVDVGALARFFHESLAVMTAQVCEEIKNLHGIKTVALSGGVFQNSLLTSLTAFELKRRGFKVLLNKIIPPNDGGICIGQSFFMS